MDPEYGYEHGYKYEDNIGFLGWVEIFLNSLHLVYRHQFKERKKQYMDVEEGQWFLDKKGKIHQFLDNSNNHRNMLHTSLLEGSVYPYTLVFGVYSWLTWGVTHFISALSFIPWVIGSLAFYGLKWISALPLMPAFHTLLKDLPVKEMETSGIVFVFAPPWDNGTAFSRQRILIFILLCRQIWFYDWLDQNVHILERARYAVWALVRTLFAIVFLLVNFAEALFNMGCCLLFFVPKLVNFVATALVYLFLVESKSYNKVKPQSRLSIALLSMTFYFAFFGTAALLPAFLAGASGFIISYLLVDSRLPGGVTSLGDIFNTGLWALAAAAIVLMVCSPQLLLAVPVAMKAALLPSISTTLFSGLFAMSVGMLTAFVSAFVISPLSECLANRCCYRPGDHRTEMTYLEPIIPSYSEKEPEPCCLPLAWLYAKFSCCFFSTPANGDGDSLRDVLNEPDSRRDPEAGMV